MPDLASLRQRYAYFSDEEIAELAVRRADQLTAEGLTVLQEEVRKRGLSAKLDAPLSVQAHPIAPGDLQNLAMRLRQSPCPECGSPDMLLNAFEIAKAKSFLLLTAYSQKLMVACPDCIRACAKKANLLTLLMGWWGLPWGPIRTLQAASKNDKAIRDCRQDHPSEALIAYVRDHRGEITAMLNESQWPRE